MLPGTFDRELEEARVRIRAEYEPRLASANAKMARTIRRQMGIRIWWEKVRLTAKHAFVMRRII